MRNEDELYYSRKWLNTKRGRAHTIACVDGNLKEEPEEYSSYKRKPYIDAYFEISDCYKNVSLDFSIGNLNDKRECNKIKKKLERFRKEFEAFESAVLEAIEYVQ